MSEIVNEHLDGRPFLWKSGRVGILLVHGWTATPVEIRLLAENLYAAGYSVAGPTMAGHGTTPQDLNRRTWQEWVWSVEVAYHELASRCDQVFIGGESTGAVVSLYLASKYPQITGLLLYAPAIKLLMTQSDIFRVYTYSRFATSIPKSGLDEPDKWQGYMEMPLKSLIELLRLQKVTRRRFQQIHQPTLIVQGQLDKTIHPTSGEIIREGIHSELIELYWMEESKHVLLLGDELDDVTELTMRFIERVLSGD